VAKACPMEREAVAYIYDVSGAAGVVHQVATAAQPLAQAQPQTASVAEASTPGGLVTAAHGTMAAVGTMGTGPVQAQHHHHHVQPPPPPHMAADENYCLRWNDYEKKYAETFRVLRDDEYFTDVTLATEGHSVKAHRVILSACSNYFHAILKTMSPWQHPVLLLQDVRSSDLNSLMDFIYFGQASVSQDSLQSFLRVAEKLKIKGLCESLAPPPPPPPPAQTALASVEPTSLALPTHPLPPNVAAAASAGPSPVAQMTRPATGHGHHGGHPPSSVGNNFENLLPRSPYVEPTNLPLNNSQPPASVVASATAAIPARVVQQVTGAAAPSGPPAAHQSPRQSTRASSSSRPAAEALAHYSSPKRAKYGGASVASPQSILRSQLQPRDGAVAPGASEHVEVKSEPIILPNQPEDVPSSGVNVTEFITAHDNDLALQSLGHGISPQFIFSPDPAEGGQQGQHQVAVSTTGGQVVSANGVPPGATFVVTDDKTVNAGVGSVAGASIVSTVAAGHPQHQQHHGAIVQQQQQHQPELHRRVDEQPQDLTPGPQDSPVVTHTPPTNGGGGATPGTPGGSASNSSVVASPSTPTPPKKDRNSRKTCGYCHKDFHEMSLKRHIKDVHFRNQNTVVICPQCCKQVRIFRARSTPAR